MEEIKVESEQVEDSSVDYLEALKTLKQNTVSKSDYDAVREENKKLINSIVNGQSEFKEEEVKKSYDISELKAKLNSGDLTNLEYVDTALKLRDTVIEQGKPDPFLPIGNNIMPSQTDIECAERVANVFKECIEYAQGDNDIFTNELMRRTIDVKLR